LFHNFALTLTKNALPNNPSCILSALGIELG
jgi:hypothetical protein